jgi:predicted TIM-barrel fold metal-dependent hydrolase
VDVHEGLESFKELVPYLKPQWQRFITEYDFSEVSNGGWPYSGSAAPKRRDWGRDGYTPFLGQNYLDLMQEHLFDELSTEIAILNIIVHFSGVQAWYEFMAALAAAYNDYQIEHWLDKEPRLRGSVHIVAHDPAMAAREIDRVGGHPQMVQVLLPTVVDRQYGDPQYDPIYAAAVRNRLVIALHHGTVTKTALGYPRYWIEWHTLAQPQGMMSQLTSMLANGVFDKFPEIKVVALEAGFTWVPFLMSRLDRQYAQYRHEIPWVTKLPSEHLRDHVRFATQPMEELSAEYLMRVLDMMGGDDLLLFSSDYPHNDADNPAETLPKGLPDSTLRKILAGNAIATYPKLV